MIKLLYILFISTFIFSNCESDKEIRQSEKSEEQLIARYNGEFRDSLLEAYLVIKNPSNKNISKTVKWTILKDNHDLIKQIEIDYPVYASTTKHAYAPLYKFPKEGFYILRAEIEDENISRETVICVLPENIRTDLNKNEDFDKFWTRNIRELRSFKPDYKLVEIESKSTKTKLYEVEINSYNNVKIRGWLEVPIKKGIYPTLLRVPGYTENLEALDLYDDLIVFSINVRNHGNSDNTIERSYDMWVDNLDDKETFYYKGIYLDCIAAIDYLSSREDVNMDKLAVWGASQGGGLSMFCAAMDSRIDLCISDIPFLCDWQNYFDISHWEEVDNWMQENREYTWNDILNTLSYYDTKNMAHKIKVPVWMGIGLQDDVCPPSTSFAAFNLVNSPKSYVIYQNEKHWQPEEHYTRRFKELREYFKMD